MRHALGRGGRCRSPCLAAAHFALATPLALLRKQGAAAPENNPATAPACWLARVPRLAAAASSPCLITRCRPTNRRCVRRHNRQSSTLLDLAASLRVVWPLRLQQQRAVTSIPRTSTTIAYVTDVEGNIDYFNRFVAISEASPGSHTHTRAHAHEHIRR